MNVTNLQVALKYASEGVAVFPTSPEKKPLVNKWLLAATTSATQIHLWWQQHNNALVAFPLKKVDLIVVDCDRHKVDEDGVEYLRQLIAKHGPLPLHPWVETANHGEHHFFRQPAN